MKSIPRASFIVLGLCCCAYVLSMFHRVCPAVLALDLSRDLGLDNSGMGLLSGLTLLAYGLMQLPSGLLADRLGGRRALLLLMVCTCAGSFWFAVSGSSVSVLASRFVTGVGLSITVPCMVLLAGCFPASSFARASSIFLASGGIGSILAAAPLAASSEIFGWRVSIVGSAVLTAALAAAVFFLVKETPRHGSEEGRKGSVLNGIREVFAIRAFRPLLLWGMAVMGIYFGMLSLWLGPYLMQGCGLDKVSASTVLTAGAVLAMVVQPFAGWLSDSVLHRRHLPLLCATIVGVFGAVGMVFADVSSMSLAMLLLAMFILGTVGFSPLIYAMLRETVPLRLMGAAAGMMGMLPPLWGVLMQKIYGGLLDFMGGNSPAAFRVASVVVLVNCALGLLAMLRVKESFGREPS